MRKLLAYDIVYAGLWITIAVIIFFFPVMLGWQSLTEAVPTFYSRATPDPQIKTPWQADGVWHTIDVIPLTKTAVQMIKAGVPPLWTPYSGGGEALLVSDTVSIYYPLRFLFFFIWDSTRAFDWYFILRFFIAGSGMFWYLRTIGLRRIVSLWGAIAYAFTGYFILYIGYSFLDVDSLLPWTLLAIEKYFREKRIRYAALIGFLFAMTIVIGQPQSTIIAALFTGLYFLWKSVLASKTRKEQLSVVRHSLFIILMALLVASPFIADFLTNYGQSKTIEAWLGKGLAHFPPFLLLHFLVSPTMMPEVAAAGHLFDRYEIIIPYAGISVLLLFLLSFFIKKKPSQLAPLYAWTVFVILKNAGFPLVQWIGTLPVLSQVGWYKAYGPMAGAMVICAAIAFERILCESEKKNSVPQLRLAAELRGEREASASEEKIQNETAPRDESRKEINWRGFYKFIAAIPLLFIGVSIFFRDAFIGAYAPRFDFFSRNPEAVQKVTILLSGLPAKAKEFGLYILQNNGGYFTVFLFAEAIMFAVAALVIIGYLRRRSRYAALAMVLFTALELFMYMPKIRDGFRYLDPYAKTPPYVSFLQNQMKKEEVSRTFAVGNVFKGHIEGLYNIQKAQNNSALKPRRYFAYLPDEILGGALSFGTVTADKLPEVPQKFFDAFNIRYLVSEETLAPRPGLELVYDADMKIYRNKSALPKAYIVFQKETVSSPEDARSIFYNMPFDPHSAVILEDRNEIFLPQITNAPLYSPAVVVRYTDNEVDLTAKTDRDGVLVLTDLFYPGWQAYLDGKKVVTYPANVMFRGIFLPAGSHTITFVYEPWWFWPSMFVSLFTICGVIILTMYSSRKKIGAADTIV